MKSLSKRPIGKTGLETTFFGFGSLSIGRDWGFGTGDSASRPSEEDASVVLNAVLDEGINFIDTARAYFKSEERIGRSVGSRRSQYILASKAGEHSKEPDTFYDFSYEGVSKSIDESIKLLGGPIDIMQIHFGPDPSAVLDDGHTVRAFKDAQKDGKVRFLGASCNSVDVAKRCIESGDFDVMQLEYNLLNRSQEDNIRLCKELGIGVFVKTGLARGKLTSKVLPELLEDKKDIDGHCVWWDDDGEKGRIKEVLELVGGDASKLTALALRFLYQNDAVSNVLIGTKSTKRLKENMALLETDIDEETLNKAIRICDVSV